MTRDRQIHLNDIETARWLDGTVSDADRPALEAHLADCAECQAEVAALTPLAREVAPARRYWRIAVPLAAAAALTLLVIPVRLALRTPAPEHRAPPVAPSGPVTIAPVGGAPAAGPLVWSRVDGADRYRVSLFAADGTPLWQETTTDTTLALAPDRLTQGAWHHWKVEARVGIDRWTGSALAEFVFTPGAAR